MCKIWYLCWSVGFLRFIYTRLHQSDQRDNQRYRVLSGEKLQFCPRMFRRGLNRFASCLQGVMTHMGTVEIHSLTPPTNINAADLLPAPRRLTRPQNSRKTVEKRGRGAGITVPGRRLHTPNAVPLSRRQVCRCADPKHANASAGDTLSFCAVLTQHRIHSIHSPRRLQHRTRYPSKELSPSCLIRP